MNNQDEPGNIISRAECIKELNSIDQVRCTSLIQMLTSNSWAGQDIVSLIQAAGLAIKTLSPITPLPHGDDQDESQPGNIESRKAAFTSSTASYFRLLDSISVRLKRQIYALEEADILPPENEPTAADSSGAGQTAVGGRKGLAAGGLGNLDISWLNSRSDVVGKRMEAELWTKARAFLEGQDRELRENTEVHEPTQGSERPKDAQGDDEMRA